MKHTVASPLGYTVISVLRLIEAAETSKSVAKSKIEATWKVSQSIVLPKHGIAYMLKAIHPAWPPAKHTNLA